MSADICLHRCGHCDICKRDTWIEVPRGVHLNHSNLGSFMIDLYTYGAENALKMWKAKQEAERAQA